MTPAHTLAAQACLGILLHLDEITFSQDGPENYPLAKYAAEYWVEHARFEGVSGNVEDEMKHFFDPRLPHLAICLWIYNSFYRVPRLQDWLQWGEAAPSSSQPLHYAAFCGLHAIVEFLVIQR
jgi:hypothetical protein